MTVGIPTIPRIIAEWLVEHKFDGLCNPENECGCTLDDLFPCAPDARIDCQPGYARECAVCPKKDECEYREDREGWRCIHTEPLPKKGSA